MTCLWNKGFREMPKPLGISKDKNSILMQEIHDGVPLKEFMQLYEQREISEACAKLIMDTLKQVLRNFWNIEAVHGDLHANNLLIGKNTKGAWKVWVIDFGTTFFGGNNKIDKERLKIPINHYGLSHLFDVTQP
jgi:RIO-like serine/threonine protein kinase